MSEGARWTMATPTVTPPEAAEFGLEELDCAAALVFTFGVLRSEIVLLENGHIGKALHHFKGEL